MGEPLTFEKTPWDSPAIHRMGLRDLIRSSLFWCLIVPLSLLLSDGYYLRVEKPNYEARVALHQAIIDGTAESPYRYRVLIPYLAEGLTRLAVHLNIPYREAFEASYFVITWVSLLAFLSALYLWSREWLSPNEALIGLLFCGATLPITFKDHYFQPWTFTEPALFTFGLIAITRGNGVALLVVMLFYSLMRETALYLVLAMGALAPMWRSPKHASMAVLALLAGVWALSFIGLRLVLGAAPHVETLTEIVGRNLRSLPKMLLGFYLMFGFLLCAWYRGRHGVSHRERRMLLLALLILVPLLVWGVWYEMRIYVVLYPVVIPPAMIALRHWRLLP